MTSQGSSSKKPLVIRSPVVRFLGEQNGEPERLLKSRLVKYFRQRAELQGAYLTQISFGNQLGVALCVKSRYGPDPNIVREIGQKFAAIFVRKEHLDILFLNDSQEIALKIVCAPFYVKPAQDI